MLQDRGFINDQNARIEIFAYIDSSYDTQRKHSAQGHQAPALSWSPKSGH